MITHFVATQRGLGIRWVGGRTIHPFCKAKLDSKDVKCSEHYRAVFAGDPAVAQNFVACPYKLLTSKPLGNAAPPIVLTGIGTPEVDNAAVDVMQISFLDMMPSAENVAAAVTAREYDHLEAALHEVRHLNASITQQSEQVLRELRAPLEEKWDIAVINADPAMRAAFSAFAASQDLSLALTMHELSRTPASAGEGPSSLRIFNAFQRQKHIAETQLKSRRLTVSIQQTNKVLNVSRAFKLIPKILIDNAAKYAEPNSRIEVSFVERANVFRIICRNTGPIVRPAECQYVFYRGYRGANAGAVAGGGIGLWLAKTIVDANGGTIKFEVLGTERRESEQHGTTEVVITLIG